MVKALKTVLPLIAILIALAYSDSASAGESGGLWQNLKETTWSDGRLRVEGQAWAGTRSGRRSRTDDYGVAGTIEKEFALNHKLSVGLRAIPLFFVSESDHSDREGNNIWGVGFGVSIRYYIDEVEDGWYIDYYESLIGHSKKFNGNTGSINFMSEIGLGYEFDNNWHVSVKWRHLSNAGIAARNSGINAIGIGIGFSF